MEFFAFLGTLGLFFWGIVLALFILAIICSEQETPEIAALVWVLFLGGCWYYGKLDFHYLLSHAYVIIIYAVLYVVAGIIWSFFKWDRFCAKERVRFEEDKKKYRTVDILIENYLPLALNNKHKFFTWIILWWASAFWYIFSDLIQDVVDFVVRKFARIYDMIAKRHFNDAADRRATAYTETK